MAAEIETLFYSTNETLDERFVPWHGLGTPVIGNPTSKEAIIAAGLDWKVMPKPIYDTNGNEINDFKANTRDIDNKVLGIVGNKYKIVQNDEAFDFTDSLVDAGMVYETAGSLCGGKKTWLLGKLPETEILNDKIEPYVCFMNSFDGLGAIKVCCTPIRVVCNNTLNLALNTAKRTWSTKHMGDMNSKLAEARNTLGLATTYMKELNVSCETLADTKMSDDEFEKVIDTIYPVDYNKDSQRKINNINMIKTALFLCLAQADVKQYKDSMYGKIMAVTDYADHGTPARITDTYRENNWGKIIGGHPFVDKFYSVMQQQMAA